MAEAKPQEAAPQEAERQFDVTYDGMPGADKVSEEEASPFSEDLSFGVDVDGHPREEDERPRREGPWYRRN